MKCTTNKHEWALKLSCGESVQQYCCYSNGTLKMKWNEKNTQIWNTRQSFLSGKFVSKFCRFFLSFFCSLWCFVLCFKFVFKLVKLLLFSVCVKRLIRPHKCTHTTPARCYWAWNLCATVAPTTPQVFNVQKIVARTASAFISISIGLACIFLATT